MDAWLNYIFSLAVLPAEVFLQLRRLLFCYSGEFGDNALHTGISAGCLTRLFLQLAVKRAAHRVKASRY